MEYLLSFLYTLIDVVSVLMFLGAFASPRFSGRRHWLLAGLFCLTLYGVMLAMISFLNYNEGIKIPLVLLCFLVFGRLLYKGISLLYLLFLVTLEYILTYALSYVFVLLSALLYGVSVPVFRQEEVVPFIVTSVIFYFVQIVLLRAFCRVVRGKAKPAGFLQRDPVRAALYALFPIASFTALLALLCATSGHELSSGFIIGGSWMIFVANIGVLFLFDQMEKQQQASEQLLALNQQLQFREKSARELADLYTAQRRQVHDFRAHLTTLEQLLDGQQYAAARQYIQSVSGQDTVRVFLVECRHTVLDALFNAKAAAAARKGIDLHFEVSDLSPLALDAADLTVLVSNLMDNAIEACEKCPPAGREIQIRAFIRRERFHFIIRNSSPPVRIVRSELPSTKPDPHLHGYGLANVQAILRKYGAEHTMFYQDGHFQFVFELPLPAR